MNGTGTNSALVRRQLGIRLRRLREQARKTHEDVETAGIAGPTKMWRIETGRVSVRVGDVWALCQLYNVESDTTQALVKLAQGTKGDAVWEEWGDLVVPDWLGLYVGLEAAASSIEAYDPALVHGLLQTEDYARAVISSDIRLSKDVVERRVGFRRQRQVTVLSRDEPPRLTVILSAAALSQVVGSEAVMAQQKERLLEAGRNLAVSVLVLPWEAGAYPMRGSFALLEFDDHEDPSVAYAELPLGARYMEKPDQISEYRFVLAALVGKAVPVEEFLR